MRTKNKPVAFRATEKQYEIIKNKAAKAKMSLTDYLIATAIQKEINVIEDLKPLLYELKAIGNNLNQLTTLANMGRIREVNLIEMTEVLQKNYDAIHELIRRSGGGNMGSPRRQSLCGEKEQPRSGEPFASQGENDKRRVL